MKKRITCRVLKSVLLSQPTPKTGEVHIPNRHDTAFALPDTDSREKSSWRGFTYRGFPGMPTLNSFHHQTSRLLDCYA